MVRKNRAEPDRILQICLERSDERVVRAEVWLDGALRYDTEFSPAGCLLSAKNGFPELIQSYRAEAVPLTQAGHRDGMAELKRFGAELLGRLFPEMHIQWFRGVRRSLSEGQRLQVVLTHRSAGFEDIPFELLYDAEGQATAGEGFLALSDDVGVFHRYLFEGQGGRRATSVRSHIRDRLSLLFLGVSPGDSAAINVEQERKSLLDARTLASMDGYEVQVGPESPLRLTRGALVEMARSGRLPEPMGGRRLGRPSRLDAFNVLHISSHGRIGNSVFGEEFVLENENGDSDPVPADVLGKVLGREGQYALVTLNTCWGLRLGIRMLGFGATRILANRSAVSDRGALVFSKVFYERLFQGADVDEALLAARRTLFDLALEAAPGRTPNRVQNWDWANPVLLESGVPWYPVLRRRRMAARRGGLGMLGVVLGTVVTLAAAGLWLLPWAEGPEIQVNEWTQDAQQYPRSAGLDAGGGVVVVWASKYQDGSDMGVYGRRFRADGQPDGEEFRVNTRTAGEQNGPAVAGLNEGGFVVAWGGAGVAGDDIFVQRFGADGIAVQAERQLNQYTPGDQHLPRLATLDARRVAAVWMSQGQEGGDSGDVEEAHRDFGVVLRIFQPDRPEEGAETGDESMVNVRSAGDQKKPVIAANEDGSFLVVWESMGADADGEGIVARGFDSSGRPLGGEFLVNSSTRGAQKWPEVASMPSGEGLFVVVWPGENGDGQELGLFAQVVSRDGRRIGYEVLVNDYAVGKQWLPAVSAVDSARYAVAWTSEKQDGSGSAVYVRMLRLDGTKEGPEIRVNRRVEGDQQRPCLALLDGGRLFAAWESANQDGSGLGLFARVLGPEFFDPGR